MLCYTGLSRPDASLGECAKCSSLPCVVCDKHVGLRGGWYLMSDLPRQHATVTTVVRCSLFEACLGRAPRAGNQSTALQLESTASCSVGYCGLLCAVCEEGFYNVGQRCARCDERDDWRGDSVTLFIAAVLAVAAARMVYSRAREGLPASTATLAALQLAVLRDSSEHTLSVGDVEPLSPASGRQNYSYWYMLGE